MANGNGGGELEKLNTLFNTVVRAMRGAAGEGRATPAEIQALIQEEDARFTTPQEIVERIRQIESAPDVLGGVATAALQGASFGFLDELVGLVAGGEAKEELRRQQRDFRRERPKTAFTSELLGGFVAPGLGGLATGAKQVTAQTIRQAASRGALIGAGEGAIVGFGEAEGGVGERIVGAGTGAAFGGAFGGLLSGGTRAGVQVFRGLTGRSGRSVTEEARKAAQDFVGETPRGIEGTLEELTRQQRLVPEALLADVPEARPLLEAATTFSPRARAAASEVLPPRAKAARQGVIDDLVDNLDVDTTPNARARAQAIATTTQKGSEAYDNLSRTITAVSDETIDELLTSGPVRRVMARVDKTLKDAGIESPALTHKVDGQIVRTDAAPSFDVLQAIKLELDDVVTSKFGKRRPNAGRRAAATRNEFRDAMEDAIDDFGDAQSGWMRIMREKEGLDAGMQFWAKTADDVADDLNRYGQFPGAEEAYREGAAASIIQKMRRGARRGDPTRVFDSIDMEEKLGVMFPTEEAANRFFEQLDIRQGFQATLSAGLGGSPTARRLNLVEMLSAPTGRRTTQRVMETPVAPLIGFSRLAGEIQQRALSARGRRQATKVGGLLGESVLGRGLSASNLLTGPLGRSATPIGLLTRTPRALLAAMRGQRE